MNSLTRKLKTRTNMTISYETLNVFINDELSINTIDEFITFDFSLNVFQLCCHERIEWFEDENDQNWIHTFCLESTTNDFVSRIEREKFCCNVARHFEKISRNWDANLSFVSTCFYNVCVKISIEFFSKSISLWFNCDFASSTFDFMIFIFMKIKMTKNINEIKQKCNWIKSKMMIRQWKSTKYDFKINFSLIFSFKT